MNCILRYVTVAALAKFLTMTYGDTNVPDKQISNLQKLKDKLLKDYNPSVLPVTHHSNITTVHVNLVPQYLVFLDEEWSLFYLDTDVFVTWNDYRLSWNPSNFEGIMNFSLSSRNIWIPQITDINSHSGDIDMKGHIHAYLEHTGDVYFSPPGVVAARCPVKPGPDYPRDTVTCQVWLHAWSFNGWEIDLEVANFHEPEKVFIDEFDNSNPRWEMLVDQIKIQKFVKKLDCCEEPFVAVVATFPMKRRLPPQLDVVWSPCILIMALTLSMFWIPSISRKKIVFGAFLCLSLAMLITYVAYNTEVPVSTILAVSFLESTMYAVVSAILLEIFVLSLNVLTVPRRPPYQLIQFLSGPLGKYIAVWPCWEANTPSLGTFNQLKEDQKIYFPTPEEEWNLVAAGIDRLLFFLFAIVMAAIHQA